MFVLGCEKLTIVTDHKPLLGIFRDRDLSSVTNPRILKLKQRTLPYRYDIQYNPGKWHRGPDAVSRNPVPDTGIYAVYVTGESTDIDQYEEDMDVHAQSMFDLVSRTCRVASVDETGVLITLQELEAAASGDPEYEQLIQAVTRGFPEARGGTPPDLRSYWSVRNRLSISNGIVMMDDRVVVPAAYRSKVLRSLHSAHQGVGSMIGRAHQAVYWPGLDTSIRNTRYNCSRCNELAPSQTQEPLCLSPPPAYPFQKICLDYFEIGHHSYLSSVDRFSGWITVYHFPHSATAKQLTSICRASFIAYGVSEELSSDGGPQFAANEFKQFLRDWGVNHRISSVNYPQSNGRAEVGVKSAKRIICDNASPNGSLDNDRAARAIMQYRNTPIPDVGLSPAQLLLHRQLRDCLPSNPGHYRLHKEWILSAEERERAFSKRNDLAKLNYDTKSHALAPLAVQTNVRIQSHKRWDRTGRVVEVLPNRQYRIRIDGSGRVTLRNRRFLRVAEHKLHNSLRSSGALISPGSVTPSSAPITSPVELPHREVTEQEQPAPDSEALEQEFVGPATEEPPVAARKLPKALRDIADFNAPGLKEASGGRQDRLRGGR